MKKGYNQVPLSIAKPKESCTVQKYRRVALQDRFQLEAYIKVGLTMTEIAERLGFHKSTISREIKRHQEENKYLAPLAEQRACVNFKACRRPFKLKGKLLNYTLRKLELGWSPDQVSKRLKLENSNYSISHQSIYRCVQRLGCTSSIVPTFSKRFNNCNLISRTHGGVEWI